MNRLLDFVLLVASAELNLAVILTFFISKRIKSPVEMCVYPNSSTSLAHWVPFPEAGPPTQPFRAKQTYQPRR